MQANIMKKDNLFQKNIYQMHKLVVNNKNMNDGTNLIYRIEWFSWFTTGTTFVVKLYPFYY